VRVLTFENTAHGKASKRISLKFMIPVRFGDTLISWEKTLVLTKGELPTPFSTEGSSGGGKGKGPLE